MQIKECYVSSNGISCITNINTLHNFKFTNLEKTINKHPIIVYMLLRTSEFLIKDLIKNKFYLSNINTDNEYDVLPTIMFS